MTPRTDMESRAFALVWVTVIGLAVAVAAWLLVGAALGVAVLVVAAVGATWWELASRAADRTLRDAERIGHGAEAGAHPRRILLVAGDALDDAALDEALGREGDVALDVLAPVLQSRTHLVTTDVDAERAAAQRRLDATLAVARRHGIAATGEVGDPIDPKVSLRDELVRQDISEVVVATHPDGEENWLEPAMLAALRAQLTVPVRRVVVRS